MPGTRKNSIASKLLSGECGNRFWYFCHTANGSVARLFYGLDQVRRVSFTNSSVAINRSTAWIGRSMFASDSNLSGIMALFRIYDRALTNTERINNYLATKQALENDGLRLV